MNFLARVTLSCLVCFFGLPASAWGQYSSSNPFTARFELIASGLNSSADGNDQIFPTELVPFPDDSGRLLVGTLGGTIRLIDGSDQLQPTLYHNTNSATTLNADNGNASFGMTTLAFHPKFATSGAAGAGKFYTFEPERTRFSPAPDFPGIGADLNIDSLGNPTGPNPAHDRVLYEYTASNIASNVFSGVKREVMRIHEFRRGHDINDMAFDEDGYLFISSGDGVVSDYSQDLGNVFGKILRIDPLAPMSTPASSDPVSSNGKYRIPSDNPLVNNGSALDEIYAYGLRNPYRISVDSATDQLWVTSNGAGSRESVYQTSPGDNHGWKYFEGTLERQTPPGEFSYVPPTFEYDHGLGVSVNGAFVYRGSQIPELVGKVVFADFLGSSGGSGARLFYGDLSTGEFFDILPDDSGGNLPPTIVSIGEDADGELLLVSTDGSISRLLPQSPPITGPHISDGLIAAYDFREGSGNIVHDVSGFGTPLNLTIQEADNVSWGSDFLSIDASTVIASSGAATKINGAVVASNEITVEAWVKPLDNTLTGVGRIVNVGTTVVGDAPFNRNFFIGQRGANIDARLRTTTTGDNGSEPQQQTDASGAVVINPSELIHIMFTRDIAGNSFIYVDGVRRSDVMVTQGGDMSNWDASFVLTLANELVYTNVAERDFLGEYHLVSFYDRALSTAEILQNFAAGPTLASSLDGDFDGDDDVDGADFLKWQRGESPNGTTAGDLALWQGGYGTSSGLDGDFDGDDDVDGFDFLKWQLGFGDIYDGNDLAAWEANYGNAELLSANSTTVPEPSTGILLVLGMVSILVGRRTAVRKSISA